MSLQEPRGNPDALETGSLERNRYFNGKLMTARDMQVEQEYHRTRLHTLSRHVLGTGLVCGLAVNELTERDGRLYADIEPGVGLDRRGRSVLVEQGQEVVVKSVENDSVEKRGEPTCPDSDQVYLFLVYKECNVDTVPVPDAKNACEERCCYNRVIEEFEVVYTEAQPKQYKQVPSVDFPEQDELDTYEGEAFPYDPALTKMARSYYEQNCEVNAVDCASDRDCSLFLGHFENVGDRWEHQEFPDFRPLVYTNDMLYAVIARHVTDFDNPHEVEEGVQSVEGVTNPGGNIDLYSPDSTIEISGKKANKRVDFDVSKKIARSNDLEALEARVEVLENCLKDVVTYLRDHDAELGDACARLCDERDGPEQKSQRQERKENDDGADRE